MKHLFALIFALSASAQDFDFAQMAGSYSAAAPSGSCSFWTNSITDNVDYWGSGVLCQGVSNTTSLTICQIAVRFANPSALTIYCLDIRTDINNGGSLLGTSDTNTVALSASYQWKTNSFTTPCAVTGTFYITRRIVGGGGFNWSASTTNAFSDNTISRSYSDASAHANSDFEFAIWTQ